MGEFKLNFQDTQIAFADKSDAELREKHRVFKLMNFRVLNEIGTKSTEIALALGLPISWLIKRTVFEQFCGGENISECQATVDRLGNSKIGTILDYSVEGKSEEADFERMKEETILNLERANNDIDIPFAVFKLAGMASLRILELVTAGKDLESSSDQEKWNNIKRL